MVRKTFLFLILFVILAPKSFCQNGDEDRAMTRSILYFVPAKKIEPCRDIFGNCNDEKFTGNFQQAFDRNTVLAAIRKKLTTHKTSTSSVLLFSAYGAMGI